MNHYALRSAGRQPVTLSEHSEVTAVRSCGYAGAAFICGADKYPLSIELVLEKLGCSCETVARVQEDIEAAIIANTAPQATRPTTPTPGASDA